MRNDGHSTTADTRLKIAKSAIDAMLVRATRIAGVAETETGKLAVIPVDTYRMNLMAVSAVLNGETRAEYLAVDDQGAADIAEILHEAQEKTTLTVPTTLIEQARQLYGTAASAGKQVEVDMVAAEIEGRASRFSVTSAQYNAVAAAAMILGEILLAAKTGNGESDAE